MLARDGATWSVRLTAEDGSVERLLAEVGRMPLPPYIDRPDDGSGSEQDRERYQTVYARRPGALDSRESNSRRPYTRLRRPALRYRDSAI